MEITGADAHHIGRVLRMKSGDRISVVGPDGQAAIARIDRISADKVNITLESYIERTTEPPVAVWLAQGLPKGDKFDFIVQKAVELGAAGIIPVQTDNAVVRYDGDKGRAKVERWQKIAAEAAKQCGRIIVPEVKQIHTLSQVLDNLEEGTNAIMPYEAQACGQTLAQALAGTSAASFLVIIGPEGGFASREVSLCRDHGVRTVTLGPRILRTETAALAVLSIVLYQCGDLGSYC
jgi:16S rRNA (uracil1498-N3)-methyltransferase